MQLSVYPRYRKMTDNLLAPIRRKRLKSTDFSVICNNCFAGVTVYKRYKIPYTTPTIGLFFFPSDYCVFLENFYKCINTPLTFKEKSKYPEANENRKKRPYPIGVLALDVEVHFLHYKDQAEAELKWNRRLKRVNFNNLFFLFVPKEGRFEEAFFNRFVELPFKNKLFFSTLPRKYACSVLIKDFLYRSELGEVIESGVHEKYVDLGGWLNGERFLRNGASYEIWQKYLASFR